MSYALLKCPGNADFQDIISSKVDFETFGGKEFAVENLFYGLDHVAYSLKILKLFVLVARV